MARKSTCIFWEFIVQFLQSSNKAFNYWLLIPWSIVPMLNFFIDRFQYDEKYVTGIFTNVWIQSLTLNLKFSLSYQRSNENFWLYIKEKRHVSSPLTVVSWCLVAEFAEIVLNLGVLIRCSSFIIQWVTRFFLLPKKKNQQYFEVLCLHQDLGKSSYLLYQHTSTFSRSGLWGFEVK